MKKFKILLSLALILIFISSLKAQYTHTDLQDAIDAAVPGATINLNSGTYTFGAVVNVNKTGVKLLGNSTIFSVSGIGDRLDISADGVTIENVEIIKTDKTGEQNIIRLRANNITIKNNIIHGQYVFGDGEVSRAMVFNAGSYTGIQIEGNTIYSLRQPAYISGTNTGNIVNNYTYSTKGWVVEGGNLTFTNNTWGVNVYDIAIMSICPALYYTDIVAMSNANNNAVIEDQRVVPAVLSVVYVDASTAFSTDLGGRYHPYSTITPAITRVAEGGKILVAAGTYTTAFSIGKSLTIIGSGPASLPTTIISSTSNPIINLTVTGKSYTFQNLIIEGNATNNGIRAGGAININSLTMKDVIGRNCQVALYLAENWPGAEPLTTTVNNLSFDNVTLTNNKFIGAYIGKTVLSGLVTNSTITDNGYSNDLPDDWQKTGLQFVNFDEASVPHVVVTNSNFSNNGTGASNIERTGLIIYTAYNALSANEIMTVSGCSFTNHPQYAVRIKNGYNVGNTATVNGTFSGNYLDIWFNNIIGTTSSTLLVRRTFTGTKTVGPGPTYDYNTIQAAIAAAVNGDQINVAAGTYAEVGQIVINKDLSIVGENKASTIVKTLQNTGGSGDAQAWFLIMENKNLNLSNLTIDGSGFNVRTGIRFRGNGTVNNCIIKNITYPGYQGFALALTYESSSSMNVTVSNCEFNNFGRVGVHIDRNGTSAPSSTGTIINNTFVGKGVGDHLDYAVEVEGGANAIITNNTISNCLGIASSDGSTSAGVLATTYFDQGTSALINDNQFNNNSTAIAVGYDVSDVSTVVAHNNSFTICEFGVTSTAPTVNAELNWWGTAVESAIQAMISGPVDYDPWIGKTNVLNCAAPNINYNFLNGVIIKFMTLPIGGGNVTVMRENKIPAAFPPEFTNLGTWMDITSPITNLTFNAIVIVDVFGLPDFDVTTTPMYKNLANEWVPIPGGIYLASDPLFGGHPSFSFVTNHFTPFTFINTPAAAYDVYLSSSTSASSAVIYPNDSWGTTGYEPNDWDFAVPDPLTLYIVPEVGSVFGASDIIIEWDNTMFSYVGVDKTGGVYDNISSQFFTNPTGNQVTINAGRFDNTNLTITAGQYIAKLNLNLIKSGYGPISFTALDFRAFDLLGGQLGVFVTGNNAQVKSYLGDVASHTSSLTGDGLVDFYDLSPWSGSYWSGVGGFGMDNYKVKYDIGPTSTNNVYGIPAVDGRIQFEDFVIFAMSYGLSANNVYPKIEAEPTEPVDLQLGEPIIAGNQTRIPLFVSGGVQNVRAMSLTFAGQFGKLVSVEKGSLLTEFTNPVMVMSNTDGNQVYVDLAVFGAEEVGINTEGEVLTLIFEGNTEININTAEVRNILNGPMAVNISGSEELVPSEFALMQNYPNPFNPTTTINYNLPAQAMVEVSIYNALGERVAMLVNEIKEAGRHTVEFNASGYSSGIYFYQIKANDYVSVKKMILMK
jgi:hypothetical protein